MPTVTEQHPEPTRRRGRYPKEFRRDAASLVIDQHRTIADVARELDIVEQTLGNWVRAEQARQARDAAPGALDENERTELRRLRKENSELKMEREILRKAAAYFAKETTR